MIIRARCIDAARSWQEPPVWLPRVAIGLTPTGVRCDSIRIAPGARNRTRQVSARMNMVTIVAACFSTEWICDDFVLAWASDGSWASVFQDAECLLSGASRSVVQYCARCRLCVMESRQGGKRSTLAAPGARLAPASPSTALQPDCPSLTSSVQTLKLFRVLGPKVLLMATSAASRPRAINTRPMRGVLLRASKVYQWPSR